MDGKEKRGVQIAATRKIERAGDLYAVPALKGNPIFQVGLEKEPPQCTCPENRLHSVICEHIYAAKIFRGREEQPSQGTAPQKKRKPYHQDWPTYNEAQIFEKDRFQSLLAEICKGIELDETKRVGRPRLNLRDMIFNVVFKVYTTTSSRVFMSDLREAKKRGHIAQVPHHNSISLYLQNPKLTPILQALIVRSARPLRSVEVDFAIDSSGFSISRYGCWFDFKRGKEIIKREYIKCHLICGVKTHIVVSVEIGSSGDAVYLPGLLETAAGVFEIHELSGDKGYISRANVDAIVQAGATPFIMFKVDSSGGGSDSWKKMFHLFQYHEEEFLAHYHKRSNVESTFNMVKSKFRSSLRSRSDTSLINETLCKILCHNLVVLNHEMLELKIDPTDWGSVDGRQS